MEKHEILKRSQEENQNGDEREQQIQTKSESFSRTLILLFLLVLTFFNFVKGLPVDHLLAVFGLAQQQDIIMCFTKNMRNTISCGD